EGVGIAARRVPEPVVGADLVRAGVAVWRHLIAEPGTGEHQERFVLVTVAMRRGGALAGIDLDDRDAEAPGATGGAEFAARRADLAVVPALPRDVVDVDGDVGAGHGRQDASRGRRGDLSRPAVPTPSTESGPRRTRRICRSCRTSPGSPARGQAPAWPCLRPAAPPATNRSPDSPRPCACRSTPRRRRCAWPWRTRSRRGTRP